MVKDHECYQQFGRNLRRFRRNHGYMQIDIAVATDIDRTYVSRIETGKARVTFDLILKLVRGLEITSKELIENDDISGTRNLNYMTEGDTANG